MEKSIKWSLNNSKATRQSNLELLRIVCMLFIVAHHFGVHGQYGDMEMSEFNKFIVMLLSAGGKLGVNIYVLISGYFLVNSDFKLRRIINNVAQTVFYSVTIYLLLCIFVPNMQFNVIDLLKSIFVIKNNGYWFVTCYIAMLLISPFINKLIHAITSKELITLIAILLLMQAYTPWTNSYFNLTETAWFITLYLIAAYLRLYPIKHLNNIAVTCVASIVFCTILGLWKETTSMRDIFCLLGSISLFSFFNNLEIKHNRVINIISKTTFAIYLLHDNGYLRPIIWGSLLKCPMHASMDSFWIFSAIAVLSVFIICSLIELIRIIATKILLKILKPCLTLIRN